MPNILFVSKGDIDIEFVQLFKEAGYSLYGQVKSASEARRILDSKDIETVIINAPLMDEFGHDLALSLDEKSFVNVIIIAGANIADSVEQRMYGTSVITIPKPVSRRQLFKTLSFVRAQSQKVSRLFDENQKLQDRLEEFKLVSRAKMLLIEKNKMSEEAAHKHIDKTAKDQRRTKRDVAKSIIDMYS